MNLFLSLKSSNVDVFLGNGLAWLVGWYVNSCDETPMPFGHGTEFFSEEDLKAIIC